MIELRELSSLLALKNTGSFNAAAALLHVTPGAMSQRIKQIEESIGQILIVRSSPVRLTHAGETLIRLAQQVELLMDDARQALVGNDSSIGLTVAVNHGSLATWFSDVAIEFVSLGIGGLDVRCADQNETVKLLTDGTAVAAVSAEATPPGGCDCIALGMLEYVAVASPVHARNNENQVTSGTSLLLFDQADIHTQRIGELLGPTIRIKQRHYLPDWYALLSAAVAGVGYAVMPRRLVQDFIDSGKLITVIESSELFIPLYLHYWRLKSTKLDNLIGIARGVAAQKMLPPQRSQTALS